MKKLRKQQQQQIDLLAMRKRERPRTLSAIDIHIEIYEA